MKKIILTEKPKFISTLINIFTKRSDIIEDKPLFDRVMVVENIEIPETMIKGFTKLIGDSDPLSNPCFYHTLTTDLQMHLLSHPEFPINLLGAIHRYNTYHLMAKVRANDKLTVTLETSIPRISFKGFEFDVIVKIFKNHSEELLFNSVSTYYKMKKFSKSMGQLITDFIDKETCDQEVWHWHTKSSIGRKYAKLSKDYNPIHLSKLTAKSFGLPSHIIHGVCMAAKILAKINKKTYFNKEIKFAFKGPIKCGDTVTLKQKLGVNRFDLFAENNDRPVVSLGF